jgi:hypothetical protein
MRQLVQSVRSGELSLVETPIPTIGSTEVLVRTHRSVVSAGTERAVRGLAKKNLLQKAKARPDLVRQVVRKAKTEGVRTTVEAVRNRLEDHMPLGYSAVGTVVEVGEHVEGVRVGQRVATGGAGHGEYQVVSGMLAVPVPDGVSDVNAAFTTVASIALQGLRIAEVGPGSRICVVGLGLIGQITCRLAQASGYLVAGVDLKETNVEHARRTGVEARVDDGAPTTEHLLGWTRGQGFDAIVITAATPSSEPVRRSTELARDRGAIVVVGDVGLELDRRPFYERELSLRFARSYGPGRYERSYEDWAVDYPVGQVRWTEGRNLEAVLDLLATNRIDFGDLATHHFAFAEAAAAYELLEDRAASFFGIQLQYDLTKEVSAPPRAEPVATARRSGRPRIGILGAGNFMRATMLPALQQADVGDITVIASAGGVSARLLADRAGIPRVADSAEALIADPNVDLVVVATPHSTHAALVVAALEAGKDVFCEKPLGLSEEEIDAVEAAWRASGRHLQVGFNRRSAPMVTFVAEQLRRAGTGPLAITYRVNAGRLPATHWYHDRREGGRLLGEAVHMIDTCCALADDQQVVSTSLHRLDDRGVLLTSSFVLTLTFFDHSHATIVYSDEGHPAMGKERIEVLGRGSSAVIDDFSELVWNGDRIRKVAGGKGHREQFAGSAASTETALQTMRLAISGLRAATGDEGPDRRYPTGPRLKSD